MKALLRDSLKQLRLSGLGETLDVRLQEAKASKLDHAEFLELILADELAILDRFLQDAELIEITGRSYRLRGKAGHSALAGDTQGQRAL